MTTPGASRSSRFFYLGSGEDGDRERKVDKEVLNISLGGPWCSTWTEWRARGGGVREGVTVTKCQGLNFRSGAGVADWLRKVDAVGTARTACIALCC